MTVIKASSESLKYGYIIFSVFPLTSSRPNEDFITQFIVSMLLI